MGIVFIDRKYLGEGEGEIKLKPETDREWMEYYAREWKFWNRVARVLSKKDKHRLCFRRVTCEAMTRRDCMEENYKFYANKR